MYDFDTVYATFLAAVRSRDISTMQRARVWCQEMSRATTGFDSEMWWDWYGRFDGAIMALLEWSEVRLAPLPAYYPPLLERHPTDSSLIDSGVV
jgi:hypothetical protein